MDRIDKDNEPTPNPKSKIQNPKFDKEGHPQGTDRCQTLESSSPARSRAISHLIGSSTHTHLFCGALCPGAHGQCIGKAIPTVGLAEITFTTLTGFIPAGTHCRRALLRPYLHRRPPMRTMRCVADEVAAGSVLLT